MNLFVKTAKNKGAIVFREQSLKALVPCFNLRGKAYENYN